MYNMASLSTPVISVTTIEGNVSYLCLTHNTAFLEIFRLQIFLITQ